MENAKYVTDEIGDAYTKWSSGNIIMITAATGSGKTHFILHTLLKYAYVTKKHILYLVNRKILKEQLEKELSGTIENEFYSTFGYLPNINQIILITTYQNIEADLRMGRPVDYLHEYDYCIYDECHYFYNDSNFNTYTELSFDCLRYFFDSKIQIFISATMENMQDIIKKPLDYIVVPHGTYERITKLDSNKRKYYEYSIKPEYNYIDLKAIKNEKMMIEIISQNINVKHEKWLIFTDSIQEGKNLEKKLTSLNQNLQNDVIFIDAKYRNNETMNHAVNEVAQKQRITERIVITTAVMDNGISFHDKELRNLVIMADTKESFIQMLGRKRTDGGRITLYIFMRDKQHFQRRFNRIDAVLDFYRENQTNLENVYMHFTPNSLDLSPQKTIVSPFIAAIRNLHLQTTWQQPVLNDIIQNRYPHAHEKLCYSFCGHIAFNSFSVRRCMQLKAFYFEMIDKLELDSNAFLIQQAEWLGISDETIEHLITDTTLGLRQRIEKIISSFTGRELDSNENKELKTQIKDDIKQLVESQNEKGETETETKNNKLKTLNQNDRVISANDFNYYMELLELPYKMEKPNKSTFLITTIDTNTQDQ